MGPTLSTVAPGSQVVRARGRRGATPFDLRSAVSLESSRPFDSGCRRTKPGRRTVATLLHEWSRPDRPLDATRRPTRGAVVPGVAVTIGRYPKGVG